MTKTAIQKQPALPQPQPPSDQTNLSAGEIMIDLALASADGEKTFKAPDVIKIAPRGKTETRDGRAYDFSPETLVARFNKDKIDIAVDLEHSLSGFLGDKSGGAIGWISKLEARGDGLYGHVEWLERGIETLKARTHRYVSPTFRHDAYGQANWLHSVALVAAPALGNMPALAAAYPQNNPENEPMSGKLARLTAALGLTEDASEDAMLQALKTKLDGQVDKATHDEVLAKLSAAEETLKTQAEEARTAKLSSMFEDALKEKKILPSEREHLETLAATEEGLKSVEALIAARPAVLSASTLEGKVPDDGSQDDANLDPVRLAADAQAHVSEMAAKGVHIPIDQAIEHVKKQNKPA